MCAGALPVMEFVVILELCGPRAFYHWLGVLDMTGINREYQYRKVAFLSEHWHTPWLSRVFPCDVTSPVTNKRDMVTRRVEW